MIALAVVVIAAAAWALTALATGIGLGRVIARADSEEAKGSLSAAPRLSGTVPS
ncbi:hypothetical protein ACFZA2_04130 [Microbacterium sp. NPDC007973]|uniref:hypothetical protein n=1 Tax=Microbacterium sp. NPDC007973 TaxID=3364182 RepID=UPI0036E3A664